MIFEDLTELYMLIVNRFFTSQFPARAKAIKEAAFRKTKTEACLPPDLQATACAQAMKRSCLLNNKKICMSSFREAVCITACYLQLWFSYQVIQTKWRNNVQSQQKPYLHISHTTYEAFRWCFGGIWLDSMSHDAEQATNSPMAYNSRLTTPPPG